MSESAFIRSIHSKLNQEVYAWKVADRYTAGVPDAWYSGPSNDLWVEYKYTKRNPSKITLSLSSLQKAWLAQRTAEGRNVAVILGTPKGGYIFENNEWTFGQITLVNQKSKQQIIEWIENKCCSNS